jgi:hypothetical protein
VREYLLLIALLFEQVVIEERLRLLGEARMCYGEVQDKGHRYLKLNEDLIIDYRIWSVE